MLKLLIAFLFGLIIGSGSCKAAEPHQHHPEDLAMHEKFYQHWNRPNVGRDAKTGKRTSSCCNKDDCYATPIKVKGNSWYALRREDQRWIMVPDNVLEQNYMGPGQDGEESPDGQSHVCMSKPYAYGSEYYGASTPSIPPQADPAAFETATDGMVYCATLGGAT